MPDNNKLELVVEVSVNKGNTSINSVNTGQPSMEQAASKAAHGASAGIDGMTASVVKGAAAGLDRLMIAEMNPSKAAGLAIRTNPGLGSGSSPLNDHA